MEHSPHIPPPPDPGGTTHVPARSAAHEPDAVRVEGPAFAHDLVRSLDEASTAVGALSALGPGADVTVSALTALVCAGSTPADALQAAADLARQAPGLEPHGIALARVPGPVDGLWEWHITMTVSARDPQTGERGGSTHHADRRR
ncbi:hypothetical protein AB0B15_38335 [Streptomyces sp. NPDC045456]|uniref:hypothetical protein n=1 Tax=Streptomyces sp. NPDC045456 TaxID=3155254 RepID=UPI00340591C1